MNLPETAIQTISSILAVCCSVLIHEANANAMGKSPAPAPAVTLPVPIRSVVKAPISGAIAFQVPNQTTTSINGDLDAMFGAALTGSGSKFQAVSAAPQTACDSYVQISAEVLSFTMDALEIGVTFGYNSGGAIPIIPGTPSATGQGTVRIGSIQMAFAAWTCTQAGGESQCQRLYSSQSDQTVVGSNIQFNVDWSQFNVQGNILQLADLAKVVQAIMVDGMRKLQSNPMINDLPWKASIFSLGSQPGTYWMNAGANAGIAANQSFTIYSPVNDGGVCPTLLPVACVHTLSGPGNVSATAGLMQLDHWIDGSKAVQLNDVVMVGQGCI